MGIPFCKKSGVSQIVPLLHHKLGIPSPKRLLQLLNVVAQMNPYRYVFIYFFFVIVCL